MPRGAYTRGVSADLSPAEPICSARGCSAPAVWSLHWNNPKIHPPERRKTWLACDDHRSRLSDFLAARGFLREVGSLPSPRLGE
ncbi:MAG: hypothetical protein DIU79_07305 [Actinobacteria bacterium]|nr:MAG: hypothetical protein DIU79_07305 [Actinomycetota bacterium]